MNYLPYLIVGFMAGAFFACIVSRVIFSCWRNRKELEDRLRAPVCLKDSLVHLKPGDIKTTKTEDGMEVVMEWRNEAP